MNMGRSADKPRSVLSILFIGLALGPHFLMLWLGKWIWALIYLVAVLVAGYAVDYLVAGGFLPGRPVIRFFTAGDVVVTIIAYGAGVIHGLAVRKTALNRPWYRWVAAIPALLVLPAILLVFAVRIFLFQPFYIPSSSDEPNLMVGDYVFVSKRAYGYSRFSFPFHLAHFEGRIGGTHPERGDVAVFKLPTNTDIDYIKRVVGLPGDRIQMKGGVLLINGVAVKLEPAEISAAFASEDLSGRPMTYFRETLPNGRSYVVANADDEGPADNTDVYAVPPGHYFVLGDNRDNSQDSRYLKQVGYIPEDNFVGPVSLLFWNSEGVPVSGRPPETPATGQ
jgi:signal peptidase I